MTVSTPPQSAPGVTAMAVEGHGTKAYLTVENGNNPGTVVVLGADGNPTGESYTVGVRPSAIALWGVETPTIFVTNSGIDGDPADDTVSIIDTYHNTVQTVTVGNDPRGVTISFASQEVYVSNWGSDTVTVLDVWTGDVVATLDAADGIGHHPWGVYASSGIGKYVYVANSWGNSVSVIDAESNTVIKTFTSPDINGPISLATANYDARTESGTVTHHWLFVANVSGGVTVFDTDTGDQVGAPILLPDGLRPYNVVASQDGSIVYVSAPSNASGVLTNKVFAIDTLNRTLLDTDFDTAGVQPLTVGATAGSAPQGMAVNLSTNEVYVINRGEGTISTITMTPLGGTI
jgi:YVTN family beta-propeller protein